MIDSVEKRALLASDLWSAALNAEREGDYETAYKLHTDAHDLIMDCARLHEAAHVHLCRVNREIGNYGELMTDWLLQIFAPFGVFELVAYFSKTGAFGSAFCKRER